MNKNVAIILGVIVVLAIGGIVYSMTYNGNNAAPYPSVTPTPAATVTATDTPVPTPSPVQPGTPVVMTNANVAPTDTTVIVNGSVTPNGAFAMYWYQYGTTVDMTSNTSQQSIGSGFGAIPAPAYITGLKANTTYYFRLVGQNEFGKVSGAQYSFHTTQGNPPPVGTAPAAKTIAASGVTKNTANLNGEVTANKAETSYWFEYGKTANLGNTSAFVSVGNGSTKTTASISLSALDAGTTYYFRINAQNQFGTVNGAILNFKTQGSAININL